MAKCEMCGNDYDKSFTVTIDGEAHVFDSFECAIHALAPTCGHCGCRIIGHGMESDEKFYCCAHCASNAGAPEMRDRADKQA
ncbi:MAG: hypothetical protein M3436_02700 [Pseudomonadota bacterium]|nr:hypothetical protein [Pseudomonadota bacterium]